MAKGGQFERETARELSLWASNGRSDDLLWRSSQSGGRATVRHRKGKTTQGHYGDLAPTCKAGEKILRVFTPECKTGYEACSLYNLLDHCSGRSLQMQNFIKQAKDGQRMAGSKFWAIIQRRKGRVKMIIAPKKLFVLLKCYSKRSAVFYVGGERIAVMPFASFLKYAQLPR